MIKVLIADDSILFRHIMAEVCSSIADVQVVAQAANGRIALQKIREFNPDLLTLDMEMPEMDGLAVLDALRQMPNPPMVIVISAQTLQGGRLAIQALQKGAFDFITKPDTSSAQQSRALMETELAPRIKTLAYRLGVRDILRGTTGTQTKTATVTPPVPDIKATSNNDGMTEIGNRMIRLTGNPKPEFVLVGVSTGGPNALAAMLPSLPVGLGVPVFIVQHMPPLFTQTLAENLASRCSLTVREAVHGEIASADTVYIAPGGRHMRLFAGEGDAKIIQITDDPPENNCRPSVDYLFRSAANQFPGQALTVILTGMGSDGALGIRLLKRHGGVVIAQDESSCVVYGMPKAAVETGAVDYLLPLDSIASHIGLLVRGITP